MAGKDIRKFRYVSSMIGRFEELLAHIAEEHMRLGTSLLQKIPSLSFLKQ
jgi:hypothetical protein